MRLKCSNSDFQIFPEVEVQRDQSRRMRRGLRVRYLWNFEELPCAVSPVLRASDHRR